MVGKAKDGKDAIDQIKRLKPDMITLDVEMPIMDGIATLERIKKNALSVAVIMVSALTKAGANTTMKALELGALDFITKPDSTDMDRNRKHIESQLRPILNIFKIKQRAQRVVASAKRQETSSHARPVVGNRLGGVRPRAQAATLTPGKVSGLPLRGRPDILTIGVSTGGPKALMEVIPFLPENFPVPILIVQHMPPIFTKALADSLAKKSKLKIKEASHGEIISKGTVYIAPGGKHMRLKGFNTARQMQIEITDDPPLNHCKPSVDYCFKSISNFYPGKTLAIILTGMGNDGTMGLRLLKRVGAEVIAQDEASSIVFGMPAEAIKAGVVDHILPLNQIASKAKEITR